MGSVIIEATVYEDSMCAYMARIEGEAGTNITQATIDSIAYYVSDSDEAEVDSGSLVVADVIFNSLQTTSDDPRWRKDSTGYNFLWEVTPDQVPDGDEAYTFEAVFTPVAGADYVFATSFVLRTRNLRVS